jgi:alpha,alpha-trehalase
VTPLTISQAGIPETLHLKPLLRGRDSMTQKKTYRSISRSSYEAVIFDLDGVITKTAKVHAAAWKRLFDDFLEAKRREDDSDRYAPFDIQRDYRRYVDGKPRYDGIKSFLDSRDIRLPFGNPDDEPGKETVCGLGNRKNEIFHGLLEEKGVEVFPSTLELIRSLRSNQIQTGIVSSSKNCGAVLKVTGITNLFDVKVDGNDAEDLKLEGKPAPDIFLEAAKQLGVSAERAVVVEDAESGVQAGRQGGFGLVIGVDRDDNRKSLLRNGADCVVKDLSEISVGNTLAVSLADTRDLPSALECKEQIHGCTEGKQVAVFLDYDGTLTPIVERPEQAVLSKEMRGVLKSLSEHCTVAVVSGRDLPDVRKLVGLENILYAGSHGFDIFGPDITYRHGEDFLPELDGAERQLQGQLKGIQGVQVDRKKFAIAVHYRRVRNEDLNAVERAVDTVLADHPKFRKSEGKKIFELHPDMDWNKGRALLWLLEKLELDRPDVLPFYIGDDITDEDAFKEIRNIGIGVIVREESRPTAAKYALDSTEEVRRFLEFLRQILSV